MLRDLKPAPPELSPGLPLQSTTSALAAAHALNRLGRFDHAGQLKIFALVGPGPAVMGVSAWGEQGNPRQRNCCAGHNKVASHKQ
jgi:hypothetical protein